LFIGDFNEHTDQRLEDAPQLGKFLNDRKSSGSFGGKLVTLFVLLILIGSATRSCSQRALDRGRNAEVDIPPAEVWDRNAPPVGRETEEEILALFARIGRGIRDTDAEQLQRCFDIPRLHREILAGNVEEEFTFHNDAKIFDSIRESVAKQILETWPESFIEHCQLKRFVSSSSGTEVCVYAAHSDEFGRSQKIRWWLARTDGSWRVYDFEDLTYGLRLSVEFSDGVRLGANATQGEHQRVMANLSQLQVALKSVRSGDLVASELALERIDLSRLTEGAKFTWLTMMASVDLELARPAQAIERVAEARQLRGDAPVLDYLHASAENDLGPGCLANVVYDGRV
jgi:hypothetical protein